MKSLSAPAGEVGFNLLEKGRPFTPYSCLENPWTEGCGRLQSVGLQESRCSSATEQQHLSDYQLLFDFSAGLNTS